jgi:hypothetical protein
MQQEPQLKAPNTRSLRPLHVLIDAGFLDIDLAFTDAGANSNKFYRIMIIAIIEVDCWCQVLVCTAPKASHFKSKEKTGVDLPTAAL